MTTAHYLLQARDTLKSAATHGLYFSLFDDTLYGAHGEKGMSWMRKRSYSNNKKICPEGYCPTTPNVMIERLALLICIRGFWVQISDRRPATLTVIFVVFSQYLQEIG
jgi:hypothetical protein